MAITYTTNLNLAKPAHGDVDWHTPINENWDIIDSELGLLSENIEVGTSEITIDKKVIVNEITIGEVNADNIVSSKVMLYPIGTIRASYSSSIPGTIGTFTIPSQYISGSRIGFKGSGYLHGKYSIYPQLTISIGINGVSVKTYLTRVDQQSGTGTINFDDNISIVGNDIVSVGFSVSGDYYSASCGITFYGDDIFPFSVPHPTWS